MKKTLFNLFLGALILGTLALQPSFKVQASRELLEFERMTGVSGQFVGAANPVRGINGGGLPWVIASAEGELSPSGEVEVKVKGLVLDPTNPVVISRGLAGVNPITSFKAIVSCISTDANGQPVVVNISTALFPATTGPASLGGGNAKIEDHVTLPAVCKMPIIFVTSPGGAWFAASKF
jgi:hypothetical protein